MTFSVGLFGLEELALNSFSQHTCMTLRAITTSKSLKLEFAYDPKKILTWAKTGG